jgi:hypothetical protein
MTTGSVTVNAAPRCFPSHRAVLDNFERAPKATP